MNNATLVAGSQVGPSSLRLRAAAVFAALAIVLAMFVIVQQPADAAPGPTAAVAAAVTAGGAAAQIDFRQFICPILLAIRNAFATSPFFGFIQAIINQLLAQFGCLPSPG